MRSKSWLIGLVFMLLLAACTTAPANNRSSTAGEPGNVPEWLRVPMLNVMTQGQVTFADYSGKTVMVEGMSVWCSVCLYQEAEAAQALAQLSREDVVYISLDLDPAGDAALLADYAATHQFNWTFVLSNAELMQPLIAQFGRAVTVPDNMPIFFISPTGRVSELYTGGHTAAQLIELIKQWSQA